MKEWLEIPEVFAELFNGAIFKGNKKISVGIWLKEIRILWCQSKRKMDHYDSDVKKFFYIINLLNKNVSMKNVEDDIVLKYSKTISAIGIVRNRKGYKNGMMTFKKIGWLYQKM